jgi:hypothetical protein
LSALSRIIDKSARGELISGQCLSQISTDVARVTEDPGHCEVVA